ncbi:uncharacterized protein LOC144652657 [Oculina patagonica]
MVYFGKNRRLASLIIFIFKTTTLGLKKLHRASLMMTFNICLLNPIYVNKVVEAVTGTGGIYSLGFIHQNGYPIPRDSLQLAKSITGHWYISQNMVPEHFAFRKMNQETVFVRWKLAAEAKRHWRRSAG